MISTKQLEKMTTEELRQLNNKVVTALKLRRSKRVNEAKSSLVEGEAVTVSHPRLAHYTDLVLQKINKTRGVVVQAANYNNLFAAGGWNVPLHMIKMK